MDVDVFAPGLSFFFFDAHLDFFEEIAKFRAAWPDAGAGHAGCVTFTARKQTQGAVAALPHPDRRRHADCPAARQQHRQSTAMKPGGQKSPGWHQLVAYQRS